MAELSAPDIADLSTDKFVLRILTEYQHQCSRACEALARDDLSPGMRQFWHKRVVYYENARTELTRELAHSLKDAGTVRADFISKL